MNRQRRKAHDEVQGGIMVKSFVFEMDDAQSGYADAEVNDFCASHLAVSIVLDRYLSKMIYRVLYRDED
jgi:hypothetical protein